jgi:uncharacterized spore protein YtfJ
MAKQQVVKSAASERLGQARKLVSRLGGSRLCYGDPVHVGDRAIVPVARVNAAGGGGWGSGDEGDVRSGGGGGGGGWLGATPVGFIDIGPEGARFEAIPDPDRSMKMLRAGAAAAATLITAAAVRRARLDARRQVRALLTRRT